MFYKHLFFVFLGSWCSFLVVLLGCSESKDTEELLSQVGLARLAEGDDLENFLESFAASTGELLMVAIPCLM